MVIATEEANNGERIEHVGRRSNIIARLDYAFQATEASFTHWPHYS